MADPEERLLQDYRAAFLRYLSRRDEAALNIAYTLGRESVAGGLSLLHLVQVHHKVLLEVLADSPADDDELQRTSSAASEFLIEALATVEMSQRRLRELREQHTESAPPAE
jgi:Phosphoserine phosphatase RsbU, N-terminal domain